jgi:hypothetical protein
MAMWEHPQSLARHRQSKHNLSHHLFYLPIHLKIVIELWYAISLLSKYNTMSIVCTDLEHVLWHAANNNPECKTTMFWEHKVNAMFTAKEKYAVASQQLLTDKPGSLSS